MKKVFAMMAGMLASASLYAQPNVGENVNYYGVDFSKVRVYAASETSDQFAKAFPEINMLVISEWTKYNPGQFLRKNIVGQDISVTQTRNNTMETSDLVIFSPDYMIDDSVISEMVKQYDIKEADGTGLVILGELLNKQSNRGTYIVVYFDIASREVLYSGRMAGKSRGFGLRNFWAGALYGALKNQK